MGRKKKEKPEITIDEALANSEVEKTVEPDVERSEESEDNNITGETFNPEQDLADIDAIIKKAKDELPEKKRGRMTKEEKLKAQIKIPGSLFVRVHNMVGSNALAALDAFIAKKNAIPPELLSLDEKVMQELAPVAELAMKEMKIEEEPIKAFYIMFGAALLSNYLSVKAMIRQAVKQNPNFDINQLENQKQ